MSKGKIQTVTGLIETDELGPTLMHEHLIMDLNLPKDRDYSQPEQEITLENSFRIRQGQTPWKQNGRLNQPNVAIDEVRRMMEAGGKSIVELTIGGLCPDPLGLVEISNATGAQIIMGCGHYVEAYHDETIGPRTVESFAEEMIKDVTVGAWGTDVKAGLIGEIGCSNDWTAQEKRVMHGALIAQRETGTALNVHPGRIREQPFEVVHFAKSLGYDVDRLIMSHIDRTIFDEDGVVELADTGCILEFDLFGWEQTAYPMAEIEMPNDGQRLRLIKALVDRGYSEQVVISHDICTRVRWEAYGGHGYQHIFANVIPLMKRRGFPDPAIEAIMVGNPKRLLALD
ncbi:hypothetical protein Q4577_03415 [Marinovum sp. 2_MG-2023]|uniref:phosphotriesterase family protein n=1 Tax=unclassified Marinovum TaxID=2647166 RepID=UPI0026E1682A|nr:MULTISPECIES: hypothetical protein [unclassified Marinovum]MDO6729052.1 hypothetical protein [Marinovum sp. 2_MG-2023]MDO6779321.1 hypothetical protein [Marinovum sp. 1_MG-2023]